MKFFVMNGGECMKSDNVEDVVNGAVTNLPRSIFVKKTEVDWLKAGM